MNGTTGMIMKTAQTSFRNPLRSLRPRRLIQASTTASGCRKQTSSSRSFFIPGDSPGCGCANPQPAPPLRARAAEHVDDPLLGAVGVVRTELVLKDPAQLSRLCQLLRDVGAADQ